MASHWGDRKMHYVYLIRSAVNHGQTYIGITDDIEKAAGKPQFWRQQAPEFNIGTPGPNS